MKKKYKKPKNSSGLCEAGISIDENSKQPKIISCNKLGVWLYFHEKSQIGTILCDDCCRIIEEKYR